MEHEIEIMFFSPTNTTKTICKAIASGMGDKSPPCIDITKPEIRAEFLSNPEKFQSSARHIIIGAPVYTGKLPLQVISCLERMNGQGKTCTAVVVYGNRDYGIALKKMVEMLSERGFKVTSAGAFIGQHSYSDVIPVAIGRPDKKDLNIAYDLGKSSVSLSKSVSSAKIPVQLDFFSKSKKYSPLMPVFISDNCSCCGLCSKTCPTGIISGETGDFISKASKKQCIGCMACVKSCRYKARIAQPGFITAYLIKRILKKASAFRTEPLTIFA